MSNITREDIERIFQQKLAELNHMEITAAPEFSAIVDTCLKFFIKSGMVSKQYSDMLKFIDRISKGMIRSAISRGIGAMLSCAMTNNTIQGTSAAMESVLKWLEKTNETDPDKIGYIIDQYIRYWTFYFSEDYHIEDPSALKQFEPDLAFKHYKK